jgi:hypothetical protein
MYFLHIAVKMNAADNSHVMKLNYVGLITGQKPCNSRDDTCFHLLEQLAVISY